MAKYLGSYELGLIASLCKLRSELLHSFFFDGGKIHFLISPENIIDLHGNNSVLDPPDPYGTPHRPNSEVKRNWRGAAHWMIVWEFSCKSRSLPDINTREPLCRKISVFFACNNTSILTLMPSGYQLKS
jgi:hypothetical protein